MTPDLDKIVYTTLGNNVKAKREAKGLNLRELAAICDVDHSKIGAIELGKLNCKINTILKIAKGLETPLNELFKPY